MNSERQWHYHKRARMVKDVRERFHWLALEQKIPKLERITVDATPLLKSKNAVPDVGACYPSVKAAIDGLVDARIIPDDDYKCPVCDRDIEEIGKYNQPRLQNWVLDHCHDTNTFRGWLCHKCNTGLGGFNDSLTITQNAVIYLVRHKENI